MFLLGKDVLKVKEADKKGRGVFAAKNIEAGTVIGDYLGRIVADSELVNLERSTSFYSMYYTAKTSVFPDVKSDGAHLINHSCMPNCAMYVINNHTLIYTLRKIEKREELCYSYQVNPRDVESMETLCCYCNTPMCTGTFYTTAENISRVSKYFRKTTGQYYGHKNALKVGEILLPLTAYPSVIPDIDVYDIYANTNVPPVKYSDATLPDVRIIRQRIRETGRTLHFVKLNAQVIGVSNSHMILN